MKLLSNIVGIVALSFTLLAQAAGEATGPNKVFIEQIGNSNTVTIEQVGGTNNVGGIAGSVSVDQTGVTTLTPTTPSSSNYGTISGSSNSVNINQQGDANSAQYNIKGSNNVYNSQVTGSGNKTKLTKGNTNTNTLRSTVNETITGNGNTVIKNVVGNDINSTTTISGSTNQVTKDLSSTNGSSTLSITGNNNIVNAQQVDVAGAVGHRLTNAITGDYNSVTTQQQGTNDTTIDIKTAGDHNTVTVRSSSSTILNPVSAIAR